MEESERETGGESSSVPRDQTSTLSACEQPESDQSDSEDDLDKKLDISSDQFDPLLALYSPQVPLPFPNIKCFNNIAEYESFIKGGRGRAKPENVEKRLRKARKGVADPERIERLRKLMVNNPIEEGEQSGRKQSRGKQKARKNVLTRMPLHEGSPLGELNRCVQERIRVKVHIRSFKGLRGVCTGFVVAFDKFWNLAMVDVDETYREPLLGEAFYHEKALTITRLFQKLQLQESKAAAAATSKPTDQSSESHYATRSSRTRNPGSRRECVKGGADPRTAVHYGLDAGSERRPKEPKPKVEYGRVCTRHVNQLFIRGENVLLVNVQRE
ncbi:U7 snRNA-associated Sm-like protein LSm11 [Salminus brasiliensis]|uniref:U7 snRNA-associated Sm-like protein LSm11 n=1 Tax=Salminus brasiliensis TaxID=930266 RepID=UPI003B82F4D7